MKIRCANKIVVSFYGIDINLKKQCAPSKKRRFQAKKTTENLKSFSGT